MARMCAVVSVVCLFTSGCVVRCTINDSCRKSIGGYDFTVDAGGVVWNDKATGGGSVEVSTDFLYQGPGSNPNEVGDFAVYKLEGADKAAARFAYIWNQRLGKKCDADVDDDRDCDAESCTVLFTCLDGTPEDFPIWIDDDCGAGGLSQIPTSGYVEVHGYTVERFHP